VSAAPGAVQEVLLRSDYNMLVNKGLRPRVVGSIGFGVVPSDLLSTQQIAVGLAQVARFRIEDEPLRAIERAGSSAQIYWTTPHKMMRKGADGSMEGVPFSNVFIRGAMVGTSFIRLHLKSGIVLVIPIQVQ
jgi:hypothetical protein